MVCVDRNTDRQAAAFLTTPVVSIVRLLPLFTLVGLIGIPAHCPSFHLSVCCNLEPDITKKLFKLAS